MRNPIIIFLSILMFLPFVMVADDMSVESFKRLDNDMDARINYPEKDPSGRSCAIIKVVNPNTGFVFDTGTVAVVKTKQKSGETWVYVQPGVKKLIVSHPTLGVMRDYFFPISIEEATEYELRLTTGNVHTYVEQRPSTAFLLINSEPEGADVFVNEEWVGNTPFNKKYTFGQTLQYRISHPLYHDDVGEVKLDNTKTQVNAELKKAYGSINVTSEPDGALVLLDNDTEPRGITPLTIDKVASGMHRVRVKKPKYVQQVVDVLVTDGSSVTADVRLKANYANVTVNTLPEATIIVDGSVKGIGTVTWEQDAGVCDIEVTLKGHRSQSRQIEVLPGEPLSLTIEPIPMYGILVVESDPAEAEIYIDGNKCGETPEVFERVLAMKHIVKLIKPGCADYTTEVKVCENEEMAIDVKLSTGKSITIVTDKSEDDVYIDGKFVGRTPLKTNVSYGIHKAYAVRGNKHSIEKEFEVITRPQPSVNLLFDEVVEYIVNGVRFYMIPIEGGTYIMGAPGNLAKELDGVDTPTCVVTLSDYMIGQTEVTQALWKAVMDTNPSRFKGDDLPVDNVSWNDCQEFIKRLNKLVGQSFRLPTEAEWEYAAKGGKKGHEYLYSGSDNIESVAWFGKDPSSTTHAVATKAPNDLGIYDMSGNVWEWCSDWYGSYPSLPQTNPTGPSSGYYRVIRGGSVNFDPSLCRSSNRDFYSPDENNFYLGFRLALFP